MRKLQTTVNCILIITASALFMGCASFKRNYLPEVGNLPLPAFNVHKPTATYEFTSEFDIFGKRPNPPKVHSMLEAEFEEVLYDSGFFATIEKESDSYGLNKKELAIKVNLLDSGNPAALIPAVITGLSFYTIPSWATDTFTVVCKVKSIDGKEYTYTLKDATTLVQWVPMAFAFPFNLPNKVPIEVRQNIYKTLIIKMIEDGLLPQANKSMETRSLKITFEITPV